MDSSVAELLGTVALDVCDDKVVNVDFWLMGSATQSVFDELDEQLARFLGPTGLWAAPFVALLVVGNTFVVTEEWNGSFVGDDALEIFDRLIGLHSLNSTAGLEHGLEVDALTVRKSF